MSFLSNLWKSVVGFFQADVVPEAEQIEQAFLAQFETPGGQLIFAAVTTFFAGLTSGEPLTDIVATGKSILQGLAGQELDLAGHDATQVVLDALRVHQSAALVTLAASGTETPEDPKTATFDEDDAIDPNPSVQPADGITADGEGQTNPAAGTADSGVGVNSTASMHA